MDQQNGASGVATVAKDQAGQVGQTAAQAGGQVAQTTKEQAQNVVGEARQQARDLVGEARTQVRDQAGTQKGRAVDGLRTLGYELDQMAQQGGQSGLATEVARQAAQRAHGLAEHLDRYEPADLLDQVRSYARRRPVVFLAGAAVLGVLAGRLTRNLASNDDGGQRGLTGGSYPGGYGTADSRTVGYPPAGYAAPEAVTPAYPLGGAESTGFVEPGYQPGYDQAIEPGYERPGYEQPGYQQSGYQASGGFRPAGQPEHDPGYEGAPGYDRAGYEAAPGYEAGAQPGTSHQPQPGYEGAAEEPTWRSNP
jgi:hypothetical protein